MKIFRLPLTVILFLCTIVVGIATELLICAQATALNPDYYAQQMEKHNIYQIPQNYVLLKAKAEMAEIQYEPVCKSLQSATEATFSTEWTHNQVNYLITNFLDYITNNRTDVILEVNLTDKKETLKQEITHSLNGYTNEELSTIAIDSENKEEFSEQLLQKLAIPDSIDFSKSLYLDQISTFSLFNTFRNYYKYNTFLPYITIIFLMVALMITAGGAQGLKWFGNALLFAGIILILILSGTNNIIDEKIINNISRQDALLASIGMNPLILVTILKNSIISLLYKIAILFSLSGLTFNGLGSYWLKKTSENNPLTHTY